MAQKPQGKVLSMGPFLGLNTTKSPFYLQEGDGYGTVASNVDTQIYPGQFVTSAGRQLLGTIPLADGYQIIGVSPFSTFVGSANTDGTIGEQAYLICCAFNPSTGKAYAIVFDPVSGLAKETAGGKMPPFTQAVQFGDGLYTNGGTRFIFDPSGTVTKDEWQIQPLKELTYNIVGEAVPAASGQGGTFQYAYTVRRSSHWRVKAGPKGERAEWHGKITKIANSGRVTFSLVYAGETFTTQQVSFFFNPKNPSESSKQLEIQVAQELVATINSDPQIAQLVTAYDGQNEHGIIADRSLAVFINKPGSDGNNYSAYMTITGNNNMVNPSSASPFVNGADKGAGKESILKPDLSTYQESSPVLTPQFVVANDGAHQPAFVLPAHVDPTEVISGVEEEGGETWYGALYRSSTLNPTFVFVDYLINLNQTTDSSGNNIFKDPYTDLQIQNNVILATHNDVPPIIGQVFPGPALSSLNTLNGVPPTYFDQSDQEQAFAYTNPAFIAKHQTRMFVFTLYPTEPTQYQQDSYYRNRIQMQPQLWFSNFGEPWSYDDVNQLLLVGSEDCPGNYQISSSTEPPWSISSQLNDVPMGLSSTGSLLAIFKRESTFILFGDSPAEFQQALRAGFDIGCAASDSIVPAEGGIFWIADNPIGLYFFNGGTPQYLSEDIRESLGTLYKIGELQLASSGYTGGHVLYISFPPSTNSSSPAFGPGITYCYSVIEQKWFTLPYGGVLFDAPINTSHVGIAQAVSGEDNNWALSYLRASSQDLGANITATWQSGVDIGPRRGVRKVFKECILLAPEQAADATVTLYLDGVQAFTKTWNLDAKYDSAEAATMPWAKVATIEPGKGEGYSAYATLTVTNRSTTGPAIVYACDITYEEKGALQSTSAIDGSYDNYGSS